MQREIEVKVKRVGVGHVKLPEYQTPGAAGLDLAANIPAPVTLEAGSRRPIPTGIAIQIPTRSIMGLVFARSGLAARAGINLANGVGVIDSDYIGEIICVLQNNGDQPYVVQPGDRIAQLVFVPLVVAELREVEHLESTERGCGGFGSTGV
ncbi:MAG: dUTP diphosphatase [Limnochordia bacterium]|jgi:dUTP pyrophosphatase